MQRIHELSWTECPCGEDECPIGDCECNGQLRIRSDCKYARSDMEGNLNIFIYASYRLCDDSEELGYTEHECKEEREILWVNMVTYEITCGNVKILLHLFS